MPDHARSRKPPGFGLINIAEKIFQGDSAGRSLEALIADAQQEWAENTDTHVRRWIYIRTILVFWRALFGHVLRRWLTLPDWRVVWLMIQMTAVFIVAVTASELFFKHTDPTFFIREKLVNLFVVLCGPAAFVLHPANIARRVPSAPDRGWWYFAQFLSVWLGLLSLWLYSVGGDGWHLVLAALNAVFGWCFASRSTERRQRSAREQ